MDKRLLRAMVAQVDLQCLYVLYSAELANAAYQSKDEDSALRVFYAIQNMLIAAASVSKTLWGSNKTAEARKPLRDLLEISDTSPFSSRTVRNHFEHFDERLDKWWAESKTCHYFDLIVAPWDVVVQGLTIDPMDRFRQLDPKTGEVEMWGDKFNAQEIIAEANMLRSRTGKLLHVDDRSFWNERAPVGQAPTERPTA